MSKYYELSQPIKHPLPDQYPPCWFDWAACCRRLIYQRQHTQYSIRETIPTLFIWLSRLLSSSHIPAPAHAAYYKGDNTHLVHLTKPLAVVVSYTTASTRSILQGRQYPPCSFGWAACCRRLIYQRQHTQHITRETIPTLFIWLSRLLSSSHIPPPAHAAYYKGDNTHLVHLVELPAVVVSYTNASTRSILQGRQYPPCSFD